MSRFHRSISLGRFAGIASLGLLVFSIMYLLMLDKLGRRFAGQARYAAQTWAQAEPGSHAVQ